MNRFIVNLLKASYQYIILLTGMAGFVIKNATVLRSFAILLSIIFSFYLVHFQASNKSFALAYFLVSEIFYIGFIMTVLSKNGYRYWFMRKWKDENEGYLAFEGILGFLFFHNALSLGFIASSTSGSFSVIDNKNLLFIIISIPFITGFLIKIMAAKIVSIEIYYWKDMFLGREICDFVVSGPYKYLSNPMYGLGQMQAYAAAVWYGSGYGLIAAFLNQSLIFAFYFMFEKKFIERTYFNEV